MIDAYLAGTMPLGVFLLTGAVVWVGLLSALIGYAGAGLYRGLARVYRRRVHARTARVATARIRQRDGQALAARAQPVPDTRRCPTCRGDMETCTCGTHRPGVPR